MRGSRSIHRGLAGIAAGGFTLVEMLVVLAVIVILSGLAVPRYAKSLNHYRASAAARKVAADLSYAQARAKAVSSTRTVSFGLVGTSSGPALNTYQIIAEPDPLVSGATYTVDLTSAPYSSSILSASFNGGGTVSFNGFGMPSSAGSIVVQSGDVTATVTLDGLSGMVTIQ